VSDPSPTGAVGTRTGFETEDVYRFQRSVYRNGSGPDARTVLADTVARLPRGDLLDVGCGEGELAATLLSDGWRVTAVDSSPRMVEITAGRDVDVRVAALPALPFPDARFDCVVGAWVLHYLTGPAVTAALAEIRRVLRPDGRVVLATNSDRHMAELWSRLPGARYGLTFSTENAGDLLADLGARAEVTPVEGSVTFTGYEQAHRFVAHQVRPPEIADRLEPFEGPLTVTRRASVIEARFDG
jgi:ubiquinone/menaquinone biosynthesis C-methylase UbiE